MFTCDAPLDGKTCSKCKMTIFGKVISKIHEIEACVNPSTAPIFEPKKCSTCHFTTCSEFLYLAHLNSKEQHFSVIWESQKDPVVVVNTGQNDHWFKCGICNLFISVSKVDIMAHIQRKHRDWTMGRNKRFACNYCSYRNRRRDLVLGHINAKHTKGEDIKWYYCDQCPYRSKRSSGVRDHYSQKHSLMKKITWHHCAFCSFRCKVGPTLQNHVRLKHTVALDLSTICEICGIRTKNIGGHMRYKHIPEGEIDYLKCTQCAFKTRNKQHLQDHVNADHTDSAVMEWYYCDQCLFKSNKRKGLLSHVNCKHINRKEMFYCDLCDYKTDFKRWLQRHVYYKHTPDEKIKWFKCEFCDYKSKTSGNLRLHIKTKHLKYL